MNKTNRYLMLLLVIPCFIGSACSDKKNKCETNRDCKPGFVCFSGKCEAVEQANDGKEQATETKEKTKAEAHLESEECMERAHDANIDGRTDRGEPDNNPGIEEKSENEIENTRDRVTSDSDDSGTEIGADSSLEGPVDAYERIDDSTNKPCNDPDKDGYGEGNGCLGPDCWPQDQTRHPGAQETCNGLDDDCDGQIDEDGVCPQAKPYLWVYILAGQSNMVGLGVNSELGSEDSGVVPNAYIFCDLSVHPNSNCHQWKPLAPGFGVMPDHFGPELAFGRRMHQYWPGRAFGIIKVAEGGTALHDRWAAGSGDLYQLLIKTVAEQMTDLSNGWTPRIAGFVWMQGESDACSSGDANAYYFNLLKFIKTLRSDLGMELLPIVAGLIADQPMWPEASTVRKATSLLADQIGPMDVVETTDLPRHPDDQAHYDTTGQLELGKRFADSMNALLADLHWAFPEDFSSTPGDGFWQYDACLGNTCSSLKWDMFNKRWKNSDKSVLIGNGWLQPSALQEAVLTWWAPFDGKIDVSASARLANAGGDGTRISISRDDEVLFGPEQTNSSTDVQAHFTIEVTQGQKLRFITDCGTSSDAVSDSTNWRISIDMTQVTGD
ncbi:MAG: hypothetical protein GXP49_02560 [Deltaproteobacteria bacterium]|nr:hypothetical protein [Deltaproteobacteria bacterium]